MARTYLELKNNDWKITDKSNFWIDGALLHHLNNIKKIQREDWDGLIVVDGKERAGKSVLAMICGWYLSNGKLTEDNYARGLVDCAEKITRLPDKSVLIFDESSTVFASGDRQTKEQKKLMKIMDVVGQKNLIFILCLPCYFDLNKTLAVRRSLFLLHVYPDENYKRGRYAFWGERKKPALYKFGKKNFDSYAHPSAEFVGYYFEFHPPFYQTYLSKIKRETLKDVLEGAMTDKSMGAIIDEKRKVWIRNCKLVFPKASNEKIARAFEMSEERVRTIIKELETNEKKVNIDYIEPQSDTKPLLAPQLK